MTEPWVLIAYATKCGSTAEVAYTMAEVARSYGLDQEAWPVGDVQSLEQCSAVVLVAALYFGRLHEARVTSSGNTGRSWNVSPWHCWCPGRCRMWTTIGKAHASNWSGN